jgi:sigma-B regulation protein RsbU (phosphoserine phosphatase)
MKNKEKIHVLIVEDEQDILFTMKLLLNKEGFHVTTAENGKEGLERFIEAVENKNPFDLVVTDIQMPDITGTELIKKIQEIAPGTPTLVITGYGNKEMVVELMRLGCLDYLDKPFAPPDLLEHIQYVLEKSRAQREREEKEIRLLKRKTLGYESQLAFYRNTLEQFEMQLKSARGTYENLIQVDKDSFPLPIVWRMKQLAELGGDYFDFKASSQFCDILVADVSGHDMGASYHTVLLKAFFEENSRTGYDGVTFFNLANRQLLEYKDNKRIVTGVFIRINPEEMTGEVVSAGHPPLIRLRKSSSEPFAFKLNGDVLGVHESVQFEKRRFKLKPGDRYFVYTDGLINANRIDGSTGKKYKLSQSGLERLIRKNNKPSLVQSLGVVWDEILAFCRHKPSDDMLLLGFEIPGSDVQGETYV